MKRWNLAVGKSAKVLSVLLTVTMSFSVFGCGAAGKTGSASSAASATETSASAGSDSSSTAASGTSGSSSAVLQEAMEQVVPSHSSGEGKDETVYVISDSTGKADKVIVSDWLKNGKGSDTVEDKTDLSDIQNVKGYGNYTVNKDGTISWQADGSDIYYQGTTDKTLPVDVKLSYRLDGKDISPEDLAGKSGHVTIRFDYTNNQKEKVDINGEETEISVPFAMMSGAVLPTDTFSNVEVTNGRIMSEGNNNIVVGVAFPGLKDSLDWDNMKAKAKDAEAKKKLDDMNIPEYVEINADVKDFSLDMTMTMASSNVLSDINLTDSVDTSSLTDKMNDLQEGADKLVDGTQKLKNGTSDLKKGTTDLKTGTQTLKDGTADLAVGTNDLKTGADKLVSGASDLKTGTSDLKTGADKLADGTNTLVSGADSLSNGANTLKSGTSKLADGTDSLKSGADSLKSGTSELATKSKTLNDGASQLDDGVAALNSKVPDLKTGVSNLDAGAAKVNTGAQSIQQGISTISEGVNGDAKTPGLVSAVGTILSSVKQSETDLDKLEASAKTLESLLQQYEQGTAVGKTISSQMADTIENISNAYTQQSAELSKQVGTVTAAEVDEKEKQYQAAESTYDSAREKYENISAAYSAQNGSSDIYTVGTGESPEISVDANSSSNSESAPNTISSEAVVSNTAQNTETTSETTPAAASTPETAGSSTVSDTTQKSETPESNGVPAVTSSDTTASSTVPAPAASSETTASSTTPADDATSETTGTGTMTAGASTDTAVTSNKQSTQDKGLENSVIVAEPVTENAAPVRTMKMMATQNTPTQSTGYTQEMVDLAKAAMDSAEQAKNNAYSAYQAEVKLLGVQSIIKEDSSSNNSMASLLTSLGTDAAIMKNKTDGTDYGAMYASIKVIAHALTIGIQTAQLSTKLLDAGLTEVSNGLAALQTGVSKLSVGSKILSAGTSSLKSGTATLVSSTDTLGSGVSSLKSGADQLKSGTSQLVSGTQTLDSGAGSLVSGSATLQSGAHDLDTGAGTLASGASDLASGASSLQGGVNDLDTGADKLDNGAGDLLKGTKDLDSGAGDLNTGAGKLDSGAGDLLEGTITLDDGVKTLDSGASNLLDGMLKLNDEGIKKLTELFGDNVSDVVDRINAVADAGKNYNSFTESLDVTSDNGDGQESGNNVKFIYKTDAIEAPDSEKN